MGRTVDSYLAPHSPWHYLANQRPADIVQRTCATAPGLTYTLAGTDLQITGFAPLVDVLTRPSGCPG